MSRRAYGLRAWLVQRLTAILLAVYSLYLLGYFLFTPPGSHAEWQAWISQPIQGSGLLLCFAALLLHAWVGFRDVLIDYIHPFALRLILLSFLALGLAACGLWALRLILVPLAL